MNRRHSSNGLAGATAVSAVGFGVVQAPPQLAAFGKFRKPSPYESVYACIEPGTMSSQ
jgi:hypothetical protein